MSISAGIEPADTHVSGACDGGSMEALVELWRRVDVLNALPAAGSASGPRALAAAEAIARVRHATDALLAPYAARLQELSDPMGDARFARWKGFPSAAAMLSAFTGLSVAEASKLIGIGRTLADAGLAEQAPPVFAVLDGDGSLSDDNAAAPVLELVPTVNEESAAPGDPAPAPVREVSPLAAAIRASSIGTEKANIIRRTLEDMTIDTREVERMLVERAGGLPIAKFRRLCLETLAECDPQGHALREARQYRDRYVTFFEEADGMVVFHGRLAPVLAAPMKAWMEAELDAEVFAQRGQRPEEQRKIGQILADVLVTTFNHAIGCTRATTRPKTTLVIRASKDALESGKGWARCDGIEAPLTIGAALALAVDAELVPLLQGANGEPLALGRARRSASRAQRQAVAERDKGCARCERAISKCDAHHIIEWGDGGLTNVENLVMLCVSCHHIVHEEGWGIVVENNQVWFIPPPQVDPKRRRQPGSSARLAA